MNINKMNARIVVEHYTEYTNEIGEIYKDWTVYRKLWAQKKEPKTVISEQGEKQAITYGLKFIVRYRDDLDENMRVIYKNKIYNIDSITSYEDFDDYKTVLECSHFKEGVYNE